MPQVFTNASTNGTSKSFDAKGHSQVQVSFASTNAATVTLQVAPPGTTGPYFDITESELTFSGSGAKRFAWNGLTRAKIASATTATDISVWLDSVTPTSVR